ncbi:MAG TPA: four helix bundle protein [Labilithrix sp.]
MKGDDIAERLLVVGSACVRIARRLPRDLAGRTIATQLIRCGTAGGANYAEARCAESRADFIHKIAVAAKEVRETSYWLSIIERTQLTAAVPVERLIAETNERVAILMASMSTARGQEQSCP